MSFGVYAVVQINPEVGKRLGIKDSDWVWKVYKVEKNDMKDVPKGAYRIQASEVWRRHRNSSLR